MKSLVIYAFFVIGLIRTLPALLSLSHKKNTYSRQEYLEFCQGVGRRFAESQLEFANAKVTVYGAENVPEGAVLFVSNHPSFFDICVFLACIPRMSAFVAKSELARIPILKRWMTEYGCIFLDRSDIKKSAKSINSGIDILKSGCSLIIFPEGTRSKGPTTLDFKAGSFKLATKSKVPIVPVTIDGTYKLLEAYDGTIKPIPVDVYIHPPISTRDLTQEEGAALYSKVRDMICAKLPALKHHNEG